MINQLALLTGHRSFIGQNIKSKLTKGFLFVDKDELKNYSTRYLFHFSSPSSQILFARNPEYCVSETIDSLKKVIKYCRRTGAKLILPSTGLLSNREAAKYNEYAMTKYLSEQIALKSGIEVVIPRIYAAYGPGEEHKRDYKSVISLFMEEIINDQRPVIFGDGEQTRDFIYITDLIDDLIYHAEFSTGIVEIGTGVATSFNTIIDLINHTVGKNIEPWYADRPTNYIEETRCDSPIKNPIPVSLGIAKLYDQVYRQHNNQPSDRGDR